MKKVKYKINCSYTSLLDVHKETLSRNMRRHDVNLYQQASKKAHLASVNNLNVIRWGKKCQ